MSTYLVYKPYIPTILDSTLIIHKSNKNSVDKIVINTVLFIVA